MKYAVVDIETTGNGIKGNKITEIAIFIHNGTQVIDEFTSLVNPETDIPFYITSLTGIDNAMVALAPKFCDIAPKINEITKDAVFIAHSVNFDFPIVKAEMENSGFSFQRKKMCTVRLSRSVFPGYNSYSLGKLCSALKIPLQDRHRARGDAKATVLLFEKILKQPKATELFKKFLNVRSREATLPPLLKQEVLMKIPNLPGIYFFKNKEGKIIYVGKAINLKKRVIEHFYDRSEKELKMCREVAHIDYELSGNELLALLLESNAIKHHFPMYNRAQKRITKRFGVFSFEDRTGITHLAVNPVKNGTMPHMTFYSLQDSRAFMERICMDFNLCPKYCHLQEHINECSHYLIRSCEGICRGQEDVANYNQKVNSALQHIKNKSLNFIIKEKGRHLDESAVIIVKDGFYKGYGFVDKDIEINSWPDLEAHLNLQKDNPDIQRIIMAYISKPQHQQKIEYFPKLFGTTAAL